MDDYKNFAIGIVAAPPAPAQSGTSLRVAPGHGVRFPVPPFNVTICPRNVLPDPVNAEIARCTAILGDDLILLRAQQDTMPRAVVAGDLIAATITDDTLIDLHNPVFAKYLVQQAYEDLPNAQAIGDLETGYLKGETGTGIISSVQSIAPTDLELPEDDSLYLNGDGEWTVPPPTQGPQGEQGPPGPPGGSSSVFFYKADTHSTAPNDPGAGFLRWNNLDQHAATALYVDWLTTDDFDAHMFFLLTRVAGRFAIQDADLADNIQAWEMTGPAIQYPDWFEVPVRFINFSGPGVFAHNQKIAVMIVAEGAPGPVGPPGEQGPPGPPGPGAVWVVREIPTGIIDGINATFTLINLPIVGSEQVFLNGLLQDSRSVDYGISGNVITFIMPPYAGDRVLVTYARS